MAEGGSGSSQQLDTSSKSTTDTSSNTNKMNSTDSASGVQFLEIPEGRRIAYHKIAGSSPGVVFIHGLRSDMEGLKAKGLEDYCRRCGTSYVRFDLSGHGQSSLDFKEANLTTWLEDMNAVFSSLTSGPQVIVGSSIGGWLMFLYTMRNPDKVCGLIGVAAAPDLTHELWKNLDKEARQEVKKSGKLLHPSPYSDEPYELTLQLIQDGDKYSIMDMPGIEYIKVPMWLFHGEKDAVIPPSTALKIMQKLQCPVSMNTVQDGDHRLSRPQDIELITQALGELLNPQDNSTGEESTDITEKED